MHVFRFFSYIYNFFYILRDLIEFLSITISQVPHPRKRLILRGSCPHSRLSHTSDVHSHSYSSVGFSHPAAHITDISWWDGLHLHFLLCVSVNLVIIDPVHQGDAQGSHPLCQVGAYVLLCGVVGWLYCL